MLKNPTSCIMENDENELKRKRASALSYSSAIWFREKELRRKVLNFFIAFLKEKN